MRRALKQRKTQLRAEFAGEILEGEAKCEKERDEIKSQNEQQWERIKIIFE